MNKKNALDKKYTRLRVIQLITFIISIVTAIAPAVLVAVKVASTLKSAEEGWGLAGYAVVVIAIGVLLIVGGIMGRYRSKLPWALTSTIGSWVMVCLLEAIQRIISNTLLITWALALGCSCALILSSISDLCKALADGIEKEAKNKQ